MTAPADTMLVTMTRRDLAALLDERVRDALAEHLPPPSPALLDQAALARELGVSARTVYTLRQEGLPTVLVGDSPRFDRADVLAWLKGKERPATQLKVVGGTTR